MLITLMCEIILVSRTLGISRNFGFLSMIVTFLEKLLEYPEIIIVIQK